MGAKQSKEEMLYQAVRGRNHAIVKTLCRDGASLEWTDKEGRTPLFVACSHLELLDMCITLLNLGADMNAYRPGCHGGFPLHQAAKKGLEKTVILLLSRGANPLVFNDDNRTPLEMARSRGHVNVVRLLEERLCLFSGIVREVTSFSCLGSLGTKKLWAVVLPTRCPREYELAIYEAPKVCMWTGVDAASAHPAGVCNVAQPSIIIPLASACLEKKLDLKYKDLVLQITYNKAKYKLLPGKKGDRTQTKKLYEACIGISQGVVQAATEHVTGVSSPRVGSGTAQDKIGQVCCECISQQPILQTCLPSALATSNEILSSAESLQDEDLVLALALNESLRTAAEEGIIPLSPSAPAFPSSTNSYEGTWDLPSPSDDIINKHQKHRSPSCNEPAACIDVPSKETGTCIICWDAPTEGICIPCGHLAGCMECLSGIKSKGMGCPVCRESIVQVIKVYAM